MALSKDIILQQCTIYKEKAINVQRFTWWFKLLLLSPTILWFAEFNLSKYIPNSARPVVDTTTLPYLDSRLLLGHTLLHFPRNVLENHSNLSGLIDFLDLLSAFVYVIHFCFAWIFALGIYLYWRKKTDLNGKPFINPWTFLYCLGLLNLFCVTIQLMWPTAPPWYLEVYGTKPPSYGIVGSPAGLENADKLLGFRLFGRIYGNSPIVFGSFPSLHGAWPIMITIFSPPGRVPKVLGIAYVSTVWWAAMYLNHHYLTDLLGGLIMVIFCYMFGLSSLHWFIQHFKDRIYGRGAAKLVRYPSGSDIGEPVVNLEMVVVDDDDMSSPRTPMMKRTLSRDDTSSMPLLDESSLKSLDSNSSFQYVKSEKHL